MNAADYDRLNWRQRQILNDRLRKELADLTEQIATVRKVHAHEIDQAATMTEAERILATLPVDPDAARHRADLERALTRKEAA